MRATPKRSDDRGATSTVGSLLLVVVVVVAFAVTGLYALGQFGDELGTSAPAAAFSFSYDADEGVVTVRNEGGETVDDGNTDRLALRVTDADAGTVETHDWSALTGGGALSVSAGAELSVADAGTGSGNATVGFTFEAGDTVELLWRADGQSDELAAFTVPEDSRSLATYLSGLQYEYYEAAGSYTSLPDFDTEPVDGRGTVATPTLAPATTGNDFAFRFTGYLQVPEDGQYTLYTDSDDGSRVYLNGSLVVDNSGLHAAQVRSGTTTLEAGLVPITVTYFEHTGQEVLDVDWAGPNTSKESIPADALYRSNTVVAGFDTTCTGLNCTLNASATDSPGGSVQEYRWSFGDGTTRTTTTPVVDYEYATNGTFDATLTVVGPTGATSEVTRSVDPDRLRPADSPGSTSSGLAYEYYEAGSYTSLPDFDAETPETTGTVSNVDVSVRERGENFALRFTGYVEVPEDGRYTFYTASDDGSRLYVGDELVVDNPGLHPRTERSGTIDLEAGRHEITIVMFEHTGQEVLDVDWAGPGFDREPIHDANLSHGGSPSIGVGVAAVGPLDSSSGGPTLDRTRPSTTDRRLVRARPARRIGTAP